MDEERRQAQIAARRQAANRRAAEMTPEHELEEITEERIKFVSDSLVSNVRYEIESFYELHIGRVAFTFSRTQSLIMLMLSEI